MTYAFVGVTRDALELESRGATCDRCGSGLVRSAIIVERDGREVLLGRDCASTVKVRPLSRARLRELSRKERTAYEAILDDAARAEARELLLELSPEAAESSYIRSALRASSSEEVWAWIRAERPGRERVLGSTAWEVVRFARAQGWLPSALNARQSDLHRERK